MYSSIVTFYQREKYHNAKEETDSLILSAKIRTKFIHSRDFSPSNFRSYTNPKNVDKSQVLSVRLYLPYHPPD